MRRNQLNGSGGFGTLTYALVSGGNAATAGTFGTIQVNPNGTYTYTLTSPFDTNPDDNNGANTEVAESFTYRVTDAQGNTATGTITVNIVDDVPTATLDSGNVNEGALLTVAASGVLSNDVAGADGFAAGGGVVGVRAAGGDLTTQCDDGRQDATLPGCTARSFCMRTAATPTSRRRTTSRRTPPTCSSTRSRTATATCRRRR